MVVEEKSGLMSTRQTAEGGGRWGEEKKKRDCCACSCFVIGAFST